MQKYIIVAGNPVDEFTYHGPFDTHTQANEAAEGNFSEWWIAPLHAPDL